MSRRQNKRPRAPGADGSPVLHDPGRALPEAGTPADPANPAPPPPPGNSQSEGGRQRRLRSLKNVRSFVASVLRSVEAEGVTGGKKGDPARARVMLYGAQILAELIKGTDIEDRLAKLEAEQAEIKALRIGAERAAAARGGQ